MYDSLIPILMDLREPFMKLLLDAFRNYGYSIVPIKWSQDQYPPELPDLVAANEEDIWNIYLRFGTAEECCRESEYVSSLVDDYSASHNATPLELSIMIS